MIGFSLLPYLDERCQVLLKHLKSVIWPTSSDKITPPPFYEQFPPEFYLPDLVAITERAFELKKNPHQDEVNCRMREWFMRYSRPDFVILALLKFSIRYNVYNTKKSLKFMDVGKFDLFAGLTFPNADATHLETCLAFFFWAFSV